MTSELVWSQPRAAAEYLNKTPGGPVINTETSPIDELIALLGTNDEKIKEFSLLPSPNCLSLWTEMLFDGSLSPETDSNLIQIEMRC